MWSEDKYYKDHVCPSLCDWKSLKRHQRSDKQTTKHYKIIAKLYFEFLVFNELFDLKSYIPILNYYIITKQLVRLEINKNRFI